MYVDKKSPIPVYYQLRKIILGKIESGVYRPGDVIPSERELGDSLNISRMTVRQALNQLVNEGVLYREKGKGTFVSRVKFEQKNIMSFSDLVRKKGLIPSTRVLNFNKVKVPHEIAEILEIKENDIIYNFRRLRLAGQMPVGIEEVFIPERYCPGLENLDLTGSLYKLVREEYSHVISYVDNTIESSAPSKDEKKLLDISKKGTSILRINGIYYTDSQIKLFYEKSIYNSEEYKYSVRVYVHKDIE